MVRLTAMTRAMMMRAKMKTVMTIRLTRVRTATPTTRTMRILGATVMTLKTSPMEKRDGSDAARRQAHRPPRAHLAVAVLLMATEAAMLPYLVLAPLPIGTMPAKLRRSAFPRFLTQQVFGDGAEL